MYKYKVKMYKRLRITVNQTDGLVLCFKDQNDWSSATFKKVEQAPKETLTKARQVVPKCQEGAQGKKRLWVKMLTQNRCARGKKITEWLKNESVANHSAMGWAKSYKNGSKNLAIVHGRVRDDVEKKMPMKNIKKWRITTIKWRITTIKWRSTS